MALLSGFVVGANCYYLASKVAADPSSRDRIRRMLRTFPAGCLIRTWAFHDSTQNNSYAMQLAPGTYNELALQALDWVIHECKLCNLRLLLTLTNYWPDYGGLQQYVRWSKSLSAEHAVQSEQFYADATAQAMFASYVGMVLQRTNSLTDSKYCEEDTIFGWDLINEPRCECSSGISPAAMRSWLATAVSHLKSQAGTKQLVTVGVEGFWGDSTPDHVCHNPYPATSHGCDWVLEAGIPGLDFLSFHMYPDHWLPNNASTQQVEGFTNSWIKLHGEYGRKIGKPVLLTEFGCKQRVCYHPAEKEPSPHQRTLALLQRFLRACFGAPSILTGDEHKCLPLPSFGIRRHEYVNYVFTVCSQNIQTHTGSTDMQICESSATRGALLWHVTDEDYPDYDGFTVYVPITSSNATQKILADARRQRTKETNSFTWAVLQRWATKSTLNEKPN